MIILGRIRSVLDRLKMDGILKLPRYQSFETEIFGRTLKAPDGASFYFMYKEIFEKGIYQFSSSNPEPYFLDCGANIGLSVIYLKKRFPKSRIVAFEADPEIAKFFDFNIKSFDCSNVKLVQAAVWKDDKGLEFFGDGADGGRAVSSGSELSQARKIRVPTVRLGAYLDRKVDFLKIDIEGAELDVLEDSKEKLDCVDKIFVEYHSMQGRPQQLDRLLAILSGAGFRYHINSPGLHSPSPLEHVNTYYGMDMQLNVFGFRPKLETKHG